MSFRQELRMKISRGALRSSAGLLLTLGSFGCGSGNFTPPPPLTAIASTANPLVAKYSIAHFHLGLTAWVEFGTDTTYGRQTSIMTDSATIPGEFDINAPVAPPNPSLRF